jgi:hypothetical protein
MMRWELEKRGRWSVGLAKVQAWPRDDGLANKIREGGNEVDKKFTSMNSNGWQDYGSGLINLANTE